MGFGFRSLFAENARLPLPAKAFLIDLR